MPKAAIVYALDQPMRIEEVRHRPLESGESMVRLAACGVCHSDVSALDALYPCPVPVILGHEAAGEVVETGPGVTGVAKGDHIVASWRPACGTCLYCREGKPYLCRHGDDPTTRANGRVLAGDQPIHQFLGVGGFAEYAIFSEDAMVKIDRAMPLEKAALLGCAVITGWGAANRAAQIRQGDEVAVFGCGGVGLNIIQGARHSGAAVVIAIDLEARKLDMARDFGATHTIDGATADLPKAIRALTAERQGVRLAFDAVGKAKLDAVAYASLRRGGELILVGIDHISAKVEIPQMMTVMHEKTVRGCMGGSSDVCHVVPELIGLYQSGALKLDELVTRTYRLDEINDAVADLRAGRNARGVVVF